MRATLGEMLKEQRGRLGLTLAQVGEALGLVNGNFVGMVERGERMPADERLLELARVLHMDGRALLAMKYEETRGPTAGRLLAPPDPKHPRLRRLLLATCSNAPEMELEFARGDYTAIERVVYQALLEYVVLPGIEADRGAPRDLRDRLARHKRRQPGDPGDPWTIEEEAHLFVPWVRQQFVSWSFDLPTLTISIRHSPDPGDVSTVPLIDRELRQRMLAATEAGPAAPLPSPAPAAAAAPRTLAEVLAEDGLAQPDVAEILELVEFKKARAKRSAS